MSEFFLPRRKRPTCFDELAPTSPHTTPTVTKQKSCYTTSAKKESAPPAKKKRVNRGDHAISLNVVVSHKGQECATSEPTYKTSNSVLSSKTRPAPSFDDDDDSSELQWSFVKGDIEFWQLPQAVQDMINAL